MFENRRKQFSMCNNKETNILSKDKQTENFIFSNGLIFRLLFAALNVYFMLTEERKVTYVPLGHTFPYIHLLL